jgi:high-affinity nickel permease
MIPMPILTLGFLTGMQHALEADHIAAVSSIAARQARIANALKHGLTWGLGHTLTLFSFAGVALSAHLRNWTNRALQIVVGLVTIAIGARLIYAIFIHPNV